MAKNNDVPMSANGAYAPDGEPSESAAPEPAEQKKNNLKVPTKTTLNLCMKEKASIPPAIFIAVLVLILALAAVVGYFGVYKRYQAVKIAQAELDSAQRQLQELNDSMSDYDEVKEQYNKYNYEDFDKTIADRLDVLELLERDIFPVGKIRSLSVSGKTVSMTLTGLTLEQLSELHAKLKSETELVEDVFVSMANSQGSDVPTANLTITLADASKGGN